MSFRIISVEFVKSAAKPKDFLSPEVPEVAFAGRSNVGKSSLLNVLVQRRNLARTSKTPGKTRLVNFFDVRLERVHLRLVDLPGYGYIKVKDPLSKDWSSLIEGYLKERSNLKLVCALLDCRHEPSPLDQQLLEWLRHYQVPCLVVLTKCDKLSGQALRKSERLIRQSLRLSTETSVLPFSALDRTGRDELWSAILAKL